MMKFADVFNALNERFVSEYAIGFTDDRIPYLFILFSLPTVTVVGMPSCWHRPVMQYLTSLMGGFLSGTSILIDLSANTLPLGDYRIKRNSH